MTVKLIWPDTDIAKLRHLRAVKGLSLVALSKVFGCAASVIFRQCLRNGIVKHEPDEPVIEQLAPLNVNKGGRGAGVTWTDAMDAVWQRGLPQGRRKPALAAEIGVSEHQLRRRIDALRATGAWTMPVEANAVHTAMDPLRNRSRPPLPVGHSFTCELIGLVVQRGPDGRLQ